MTRSADEIEQALADLMANYSVPKGSGSEPLPYLRAYYLNVLDDRERLLMVEVLRRWLSPEQYRDSSPGQPTSLWWTAEALSSDLRLVALVPDLEALAEVAEHETPAPEGTYTAGGLRRTARRLAERT